MSCTCLLRPSTRASTSRLAFRSLSSSARASAPPTSSTKAAAAAPSSCPPGTAFPWTNLTKSGQPAVALEDSEYPAWLWALAPAPGPGAAKAHASKAAGAAAGSKAEETVAEQVRKLRRDGRSRIKAANTLKGK